jgi:DNA-binding response OmpR family regulator
MQILLVDDDKMIHKYTNIYWLKEGIMPDWASSAEEAKRMIKAKEYDYIISDVSMPIETGSDLGKWVRAYYPDTAFFLASAVPEIIDLQNDYEEIYCDAFIVKPVTPAKFQKAVDFLQFKGRMAI